MDLKKLMGYSLSDDDIKKLCDNQVKTMTYKQFTKFNNIDIALKPYGAIALLYVTKDGNYGHWTAIIKRPDSIETFDSYGMLPDDELKFIPMEVMKQNAEVHTHLINLLLKQKGNIEYNKDRLQKMKDGINTCGRWVSARIMLKHLSIEEFVRLFSDKKHDPDYLVTIFTSK